MRLPELVQALAALVGGLLGVHSATREVARLTPQEKAALVVVSGLPAPPGVAGVIVRPWDRNLPRPRGALVFADQEGGTVKAFGELPPWGAASTYTGAADAAAAGRDTGRALHRVGVDIDLAPVLDASDGPLGSRQFVRPELGLAFARGLLEGGAGACVKHFPGLGTLPVSTDDALRVRGTVRPRDLAPFRAAVRLPVPCVMVGHGIYGTLGPQRALLQPATYRLLRNAGFRGVAMTDSLGVLGSTYAPLWGRLAVEAGADLVLYTKAADARRAIHALVPLARRGELDEHVGRVLRLRRLYGLS